MVADTVDVVVLGGGAAGLMCAAEAGRRGRRVLLLEHNAQIGRKILISGGGRCNFTNRHTTAENFLSRNPHFAKSALARFGPADFVAMVERHGIRYHEKTLGQLFCDGTAAQIVSMLAAECAAGGVRVETECAVTGVRRLEAGRFAVDTPRRSVECAALVVATGGLSIPKIGATPFGYQVAKQFGIRTVECLPALVPLTFSGEDRARYGELSGVSADAVAQAGGRAFREKLLFTHRGLSGPAILQASSYWRAGESVEIDLLPGIDFARELAQARASGAKAEVRTLLGRHLAKRLADRWCDVQGVTKPVATTGDREIAALADGLRAWKVHPAGTEGYEKAEVTSGGIDTGELASKTMECRRVPGLYFIGEVVDVTGQLGGFNFHWAWASGVAAGQAV